MHWIKSNIIKKRRRETTQGGEEHGCFIYYYTYGVFCYGVLSTSYFTV